MNLQMTKSASSPIGIFAGISNVTFEALAAINQTIPAAQTNVQYNISAKYADIKSWILYCAVACTVKVNSSGSPDETFAVPAGGMVSWDINDLTTNPIIADVTKVYITNAATGAFCLLAGYDPTT